MSRNAKKVLNEAYERELEKLRTLEPNNTDYQEALDRIAKLNKMMNDERQSQTDCATKIASCVGGIVTGLGGLYLSGRLAYDVLKFEETGSISSFVGRTAIGNWLRFKGK